MTTQRIVTKQLAGVEDLLLGKGTQSQTRAGGSYTITKLSLPLEYTLAEVQTLELEIGRTIIITDRAYGIFDAVDSTTNVANGFDIVITGSVGVNLRLRIDSVIHPKQFGVLFDNSTDNGDALLRIIEIASTERKTIVLPDNIALTSQPLVIDKAQVSIIGSGKNMSAIGIHADFPAGETLLTVLDCGRTAGTGTGENPSYTGNEKAVQLTGFTLFGNDRATVANGLYFKGLNDDAEVDIEVRDFKGKGLALGNAAGTSSAEDTMRESTFGSIQIKNCGNINDGADDAAVEIGSQGGQDGANNIWFDVLRIIYPRGKAWKIRGNDSFRTRKIRIKQMFLHGNEQLSGSDQNGESWKSGNDLCFTGILGATGTNVASVSIENLDMIGLEVGRKAFVTYSGSAINVGSFSGLAPSTSKYFFFNGAATSSVRNYNRESPSQNSNNNPTTNLIEVVSMDNDQAQVNISGLGSTTVPLGTPSYVGDLSFINDEDMFVCNLYKPQDSGAASAFPFVGMYGGRGVCYLQKLYIVTNSPLTANDTDYARIQFLKINVGGGIGAVIGEVTTQTTGTGDWIAGDVIEVPFTTNRLNKGEGLAFRVLKVGSGVIVPHCGVVAELSPNLSLI